VWESRD